MVRCYARFRFVLLGLAFWGCFAAGVGIAEEVDERLYVIVIYGWNNVQRYDLHIVRTKPRIVVSNGDTAPEIHGFILFLGTLFLGFPLGFAGLNAVRRLSGLMGRKVVILKECSSIPEAVQPYRTDGREIVFAVVTLALGAALILTILSKSVWISV